MAGSAIIVIHGVGDSPPGASVMAAARGIGVVGLRADLVIDGVQYPRIGCEDPRIEQIVEVNWSDIARPARNPFALLDYLARIVAALLEIATGRQDGPVPKLKSAYRVSFEALLVYCIYAPLATMFWKALQVGVVGAVAIGSAIVIIVVMLTAYLRRYGGALWVGWLWAASIACATIAILLGWLSIDQAVRTATIVYVLSQVLTSALLFFALAELLLHRSTPIDVRIAHMALLYFPFFIISAIGAVIWAVSLAGASLIARPRSPAGCTAFDEWEKLYAATLESIGYDLALVEFTFASMVALVALGSLGTALAYLARARARAKSSATAGEFARNGARLVLAVGAATFAVLSLLYVFLAATSWKSGWSDSALEVYSWSALRFVPYLPLFVGPLATVAGIAVDIVFYIVPKRTLSTAAELRQRLEAAINHVRSTTDAAIVVAAHSQGTVIAIDTLGRQPANDREDTPSLITAGSPLAALYQRFLASTPEARTEADGLEFRAPERWINFWREGDYIGGEQRRARVTEVNLGRGGHTGYWTEKVLWRVALAPHRSQRGDPR